MAARFHSLAPGIEVIERGWLNANHLVLRDAARNVMIDSGYGRRADATLRYVDQALGGATLHWLLNTHCHSDHMGGNRALRERYACRVSIPAGEVKHVVPWTAQSCWSEEMDQYAEEFAFDDTLAAGDAFTAGGTGWVAHAAPGHDMDALMFHAPREGILVTGDALWERGMGFVWPQRAGENLHITAAHAALDAIERLAPALVVPGHGAPFTDMKSALDDARGKLDAFAADPDRNARHVAKALFVFALLDRRGMAVADVPGYLASVPVYRRLAVDYPPLGAPDFARRMVDELVRAGAVAIEDGHIRPRMRG